MQQFLWGLAFADMSSVYLAILNNVNPVPVELVEKFKQALIVKASFYCRKAASGLWLRELQDKVQIEYLFLLQRQYFSAATCHSIVGKNGKIDANQKGDTHTKP